MWVEEIQITFKDDSVPIEVTGNACNVLYIFVNHFLIEDLILLCQLIQFIGFLNKIIIKRQTFSFVLS